VPIRTLVTVATIGLTTVACGKPGPVSATGTLRATTVTVFAAASLTAAFNAAGSAFTGVNPGARTEFNFAGSSTLAAQILQGAPADVFASADQSNMQKVVDGGFVAGSPQVFATNRLEIVVGAGNPKRVTGLRDLARHDLVVVLCAPTVPCGRYALQALQSAGVTVAPASQEADVKGVVSKVALGEADAGIVYVTDAKAAGATVQGIPISDAQNVVARYPIAVLRETRDAAASQLFISFLLSGRGQQILASFGFGPP
jgi:molybdate transport system substrate-binding protein